MIIIDAQLSINLAITGSLSITFAHHVYAMPVYPYIGSDYTTMLCLFYHHMWIGGFLIMGGGAHGSIFIIGNTGRSVPLQVLNHRHLQFISVGVSNWIAIPMRLPYDCHFLMVYGCSVFLSALYF